MRIPISRSLPKPSLRLVLLSGLGGFLAIALLAALTDSVPVPLLMAPFGASCVLAFAAPQSPLAQPVNIVGGHTVATVSGLVLHSFLPPSWWALALAVGLAISLMVALRVTHPPAGADPLVVFAMAPEPGFVLFPVVTGAMVLVLVAMVFHRVAGTDYPIRRH